MLRKIQYTFELIKFSHTVFALPFALAAYFMATQGRLELKLFFWVVLCLVLARTAAMAFNRLVDSPWDALNPRTQWRHLPSGLLTRKYVSFLIIICSLGFILAAGQLNRLSLYLSPFCLALLFLYSLTKRFTHFTQLFLGLGLGMAPVGAHIAATGHIGLSSLILGLAVLFWVAGFDVLYAMLDLAFDRQQGLHSIPVWLGTKNAFRFSLGCHFLFLVALGAYGWTEHLGAIYWFGMLVTAGFLIWEHWGLKGDLSRIQASLFTANGLLSLFFLAFVLADLFLLD